MSRGLGLPLTPPGQSLVEAAQVMQRVRAGCVWSQQMTAEQLLPYLLEEAYELIEAVQSGNSDEIREELGDLLWQVLFHAAIAADSAEPPFTIDMVAQGLINKMIHRHPHVFGDATANTPEEVLVLWHAAKASEKRQRRSVLEGIPKALPALARAQKMIARAQGAGLDAGITVGAAPAATPVEFGERLLAMVAQAHTQGWDAELLLQEQLAGMESKIIAAEAAAAKN